MLLSRIARVSQLDRVYRSRLYIELPLFPFCRSAPFIRTIMYDCFLRMIETKSSDRDQLDISRDRSYPAPINARVTFKLRVSLPRGVREIAANKVPFVPPLKISSTRVIYII